MKQPKKTRQNTSKRLYVESAHGDFKILLPPGAKTTLVSKGFTGFTGENRFRYALRVYLKSELIAVFTDIFGFRPDDMEVQYATQEINRRMVFDEDSPHHVAVVVDPTPPYMAPAMQVNPTI